VTPFVLLAQRRHSESEMAIVRWSDVKTSLLLNPLKKCGGSPNLVNWFRRRFSVVVGFVASVMRSTRKKPFFDINAMREGPIQSAPKATK
jgi:hypothetical protein